MSRTNVTLDYAGILLGTYPRDGSKPIGPYNYLLASQQPMPWNWTKDVDSDLVFQVNPSPETLNYYASVQSQRSIHSVPKSHPIKAGIPYQNFIAKPYACDVTLPNVAKK